MTSVPILVGIVNCTPDSFSDGGRFISSQSALDHCRDLVESGSTVIDIGGDASGPGSTCVGPDVEWQRISDLIAPVSSLTALSVDTHHSSTAAKAIDLGASIINDISAGMDPGMFEVISGSGVKYVCMFSCCKAAHNFENTSNATIDDIVKFFDLKLKELVKSGVGEQQIILDPGMGAFLGTDANLSWQVLKSLPRFASLGFPLFIGISRKRFLRPVADRLGKSLDIVSAIVAKQALSSLASSKQLYLRVHSPREHIDVFSNSSEVSQIDELLYRG